MAQPPDTSRPRGSAKKAPGLTILAKLMLSFFGFILLLGVLLVTLYQQTVPDLVRAQIDLRAESITRAFAAASLEPVVERNYLRVNRLAESTAQLPGVAYAAAVNERGIPIAGIFGDLDRFDRLFSELVRQKGFPRSIVEETRLPEGTDLQTRVINAGGREILEYAMRLGDTGNEVHVGLFTAEVTESVNESLVPLTVLLVVMALAGAAAVFFVSRTVSVPIRELSEQAEAISMGQLDREIDIRAGGEIRQLAESFKRMQASIKFSVSQLRRQQAPADKAGKA